MSHWRPRGYEAPEVLAGEIFMTTTVEAVYEKGVLRLAQPLSLAEGT